MARDFNGNTDDINFGAQTALSDLATVTTVAWVLSDGGNTSAPRIYSKTSGGGVGTDFQELNVAANNQRIRLLRHYSTTNCDVRSANDAIQLNTWTFIAAQDRGTSAAPRIFYGDETTLITEEASYNTQTTPVGTLTSESSEPSIVGNDQTEGTARGFSGGIAMCAVFDTTLSQADLQRLQRSPYSVWAAHANCQFLTLPGIRDNDLSSNLFTATVGGTTVIAGPRIPGPVFLYRPTIIVRPVSTATTVTASTVGSIVYTGVAGSVTRTVSASPAGIVWTGVAGTVTRTVSASPGSIVYNGVAGTATPTYTANPASYVWSGIAGTVSRTVTATTVGGVVWNGTAGSVQRLFTATTVGSYVWNGVAGTVTVGTVYTGEAAGTLEGGVSVQGVLEGTSSIAGVLETDPSRIDGTLATGA